MGENTVGYTESTSFQCLEDIELTYTMKTINPLFLTYCGKESCTPGWLFGPYVRENYVIHIVTAGKGSFTVNGCRYSVSSGQMFLIRPGEETAYQADQENPWCYSWIGFNGYRANTILYEIGFSKEKPVLDLEDTGPVTEAIDRMLETRQLDLAGDLRRNAALCDALACMMVIRQHEKTEHISSDVKYVEMAVKLIVASYNRRIRIADIADQVGINRSYLTSIFKREMHMSPQAFLINVRMEKAAQLLRETEDPVSSIAAAVGYTDPLAFSKAFKLKYQMNPSAYRESSPELSFREERGYEGRFHL